MSKPGSLLLTGTSVSTLTHRSAAPLIIIYQPRDRCSPNQVSKPRKPPLPGASFSTQGPATHQSKCLKLGAAAPRSKFLNPEGYISTKKKFSTMGSVTSRSRYHNQGAAAHQTKFLNQGGCGCLKQVSLQGMPRLNEPSFSTRQGVPPWSKFLNPGAAAP